LLLAAVVHGAAHASDCPIDTYPRPGGALQGARIYATLAEVHPKDGDCSAQVSAVRADETALEPQRFTISNVNGYAFGTFDELEIGGHYEASIVTLVWEPYPTLRDRVEHLIPFTVEPIGATFDLRSVTLDRAEAEVSDDLSRITTTIEGRWPGPADHHFLMFSTLDHTALLTFPDPDDGGAFTIVYEQQIRDEDRRRRFDLVGDLRVVSPDGPSGGEWVPLALLDGVDLRVEACGCASVRPAAAWPVAVLAAMLGRRRTRPVGPRPARSTRSRSTDHL
jgi:hypothetical protein